MLVDLGEVQRDLLRGIDGEVITHLPADESRFHLASWLDLATREVVGYAIADQHRASPVVDALQMAHCRGDLQLHCTLGPWKWVHLH
ncbi:hypothetical protein ACFRQM_11315 [Streptomyces sp. NPDC056831]|uniref:hypothetical protein n=1 Tax=Streptomyces sp. NPDC056831 TaxID=3345954 RepID=UPI0036CE4224